MRNEGGSEFMLDNNIWLNLGMILTVILLSYYVGRRMGLAAGYHLARGRLPLEIRKQAILQGKCPICDERCHSRDTILLKERGYGEDDDATTNIGCHASQ